ncbi:MAG TPA: hypothetical protein DDZ88_18420 [Verrucomicrobiales bacterium]|nr:hypothetical protein [Verrucomicrobiales bacterium]
MEKTPSDYIDLGRLFRAHDEKAAADDAAAESYLSHWSRSGLTAWPELLEIPGVQIVLGEAGSGRTYEFRAKANKLRTEGKEAFSLSLHKLATMEARQAMDAEDLQRLSSCLEAGRDVWFFLDAVDESKLQRAGQFREALDRFASLIRPGRGQARIIISSRVKDWLPVTDRRHVLEAFDHLIPKKNGEADTEVEPEDEESGSSAPKSAIHVWTIAPLDKAQVKRYVEGHAVTDSAGFCAALDEAYAWELAARPLDVNLLVTYWKEHRRIGRPAEMHEHLITEQLKERPEKAEYERQFPIEPGKAREGAETLAASTILCRRLDFKIEVETLSEAGGLDARACLPDDWEPSAVHALLSRPLFDAAIYGSTRFHHRGFAEYLAACWFIRLLGRECPVEEVLDLLFASSRGSYHARQSRLPVAVWLACLGTGSWVHEIRERLLMAAPEAFFRHGDPSLLPLEFKERILDAVALRYGARSIVRFELSDVALSRMAEPALAQSLLRHLESADLSAPLKSELTKLARVGRIHAAVPLMLNAVLAGSEDGYYLAHALWLIEELGGPSHFQALADWALALPQIDHEGIGQLIRMLFPAFISPRELALLLQRLDMSPRGFTPGYHLQSVMASLNDPVQLQQVIDALLPLIEAPPHYDRGCISQRFAWLGPVLKVALGKLLSLGQLDELCHATASRALWICTHRHIDPRSDFNDSSMTGEKVDLDTLSRLHPGIRQQAFWLCFNQDKERKTNQQPSDWATHAWHYHLKFVMSNDQDLDWLLQDLSSRHDAGERLGILMLVARHWRMNGSKASIKKRIQVCIRGSSELDAAFAKVSGPGWLEYIRSWLHRQTWDGVLCRYWWLNHWEAVAGRYWRIRNAVWLRWHLRAIRHGKMPGVLDDLLSRTRDHSGTHWVPKSWKKMIQKYGEAITQAVQEGCVAVWEAYDPAESETTTIGLVPGLTGLQHLWQAGRINFADWTAAQAEKATRYAIRELNGFSDWLPELAKNHSEAVLRVINQRIDREWDLVGDHAGIRTLDRFHWSKSNLAQLLAPALLARLQSGDPPSDKSLHSIMRLLIKHSDTSPSVFAALASQRIHLYLVGTPQHHTWLSVWLQTDAIQAIEYYDNLVSTGTMSREQASNTAVSLCATFDDRFGRECLFSVQDHARPTVAAQFIRWVYRWIRPEDDIRRASGSYTPLPRDDAQSFRGGLLTALSSSETPEAADALLSLLEASELQTNRDYILHLHERQARRISDGLPWRAAGIRAFQVKHQTEPLNTADLFALGCRRLHRIKDMVERPFDIAVRGYVRPDSDEAMVRRFLAMKLSELSQDLYTAPQEAVIHGELRPDLRLENPAITGAVPIEVKLADERTANELLSDLEAQLVNDYLSNHSSRHGIFVVGLAGRRPNGWQHPHTREMLDFEGLMSFLRTRSADLLAQGGRALGLEVIGMDFRERPSARSRPSSA